MVKHPSEDRGCLLWTAAELGGLPDDVLDVVVDEVKTRTCDEKYNDFKHISKFLLLYIIEVCTLYQLSLGLFIYLFTLQFVSTASELTQAKVDPTAVSVDNFSRRDIVSS